MADPSDFVFLDATAQAELVRRKEVRSVELVEAAIERIERLNPTLNAVVTPMTVVDRSAFLPRVVDSLASSPPEGAILSVLVTATSQMDWWSNTLSPARCAIAPLCSTLLQAPISATHTGHLRRCAHSLRKWGLTLDGSASLSLRQPRPTFQYILTASVQYKMQPRCVLIWGTM
jgi:hypothetical protein